MFILPDKAVSYCNRDQRSGGSFPRAGSGRAYPVGGEVGPSGDPIPGRCGSPAPLTTTQLPELSFLPGGRTGMAQAREASWIAVDPSKQQVAFAQLHEADSPGLALNPVRN